MRKKPELLAPAGNFEKLKYAVHYGADAVYCAGKQFGLRARADNFDGEELKSAVEWMHERGKRIYVTINMIPHDKDLGGLPEYASYLNEIGVDAVLVADPGIFRIIQKAVPDLAITISTQANNTNASTANFWYDLGARKIVLARELSGEEIKNIVENVPEDMEIETFVHGAMCISYSGRCLLSHYLTGRNSNQGDCSQPCRWQYHLKEATRPNEVFTIEDSDEGSFIFNSKDLCLAEKIPEMMDAGVASFKIEGRMKSPYYVATVVAVYRKIIDCAYEDPNFVVPKEWVEELSKVSHRNYTKAFYEQKTQSQDQNYGTSSYTRHYDFVGIVLDYDDETQMAIVEQRNKIKLGDEIEIVSPKAENFYYTQEVEIMTDMEGGVLETTPHPKMKFKLKTQNKVFPMDLIRKQSDKMNRS